MTEFTIKGVELRRAIRRSTPYAASDDSRPALAGVNIETGTNRVRFVAADGFALIATEMPASDTVPGDNVILRVDDLKRLDKTMPTKIADLARTSVRFTIEDHTVRVGITSGVPAVEVTELTMLPIEVSFVKYHQLIPQPSEEHIGEIAVSATLLRLVADAGKLSDGQRAIRLFVPKSKSVPITAVLLDGDTETVIVVMPMFVEWDLATTTLSNMAHKITVSDSTDDN